MNTIKIFISCNENIQIFTRASQSDVFISLDDNIYGIHSKRVNILCVLTSMQNVVSTLLRRYINVMCLLAFQVSAVCLSLLTMTNPNQLCDVLLFVCSKMADETNLSSKLPVADRTREV